MKWIPPGHRKLGDWVESKLESIGITKDKYIEFKKEHGLAPTCNCTERREWLNRFGERFGEAAKNALQALRR